MSKPKTTNSSPQKQPVPHADPHHLKEPLDKRTEQNMPLDEANNARNVGHNEGTGRPPLMKK